MQKKNSLNPLIKTIDPTDEPLYRMRRKTDGKWYGKKPRFEDEPGAWRPTAGKWMTQKSLDAVLNGINKKYLPDVEIIEYKVQKSRTFAAYSIKLNRAKCKRCEEVIESKHRHDYVSCYCGRISVDGGKEYLRRNGNPEDIIEMSEYELFNPAKLKNKYVGVTTCWCGDIGCEDH